MQTTIDLKMVPDAKPQETAPRDQGPIILLPGQPEPTPSHLIVGARDPNALSVPGAVMPSGLIVPVDAVPIEKQELRWIGQKLGVRHPDRSEIVAKGIDVRGRGRTNDQRRELIRSALAERNPRLMKYKSSLLLGSDEVIEGPTIERVRKVGKKDVEFTFQMWILLGPIEIREMWILTPERRYMLRWAGVEFSVPVGDQRQFTAVIKFGLPAAKRPQ